MKEDPGAQERIALVREAQERMAIVKRPSADGEMADAQSAEAWAVERLKQLAPAAVMQLEYDLKYGNSSQRAAAARDVLDRAGYGKNDNAVRSNNGGPVIVLMGGDARMLSWAPGAKVVDAVPIAAPALPGDTTTK